MFPGWTAAVLVLALVAGHATHGPEAPWRAGPASTCEAALNPGIAHTTRLLERGTASRGPARPVSADHALAASRWTFAGDLAAYSIVATPVLPAARPTLRARAALSRGPPLA